MGVARLSGTTDDVDEASREFTLVVPAGPPVRVDAGSAELAVPAGWKLRDGQAVEVFGDVTGWAFSDAEPGPRQAAERSPTRVTARIVAGGPKAARRMDAALATAPLIRLSIGEHEAVQAAARVRRYPGRLDEWSAFILAALVFAGWVVMHAIGIEAREEQEAAGARIASLVAFMVAAGAYCVPSHDAMFRERARPGPRVRWYGWAFGTVVVMCGAFVTLMTLDQSLASAVIAHGLGMAMLLGLRSAAHRAIHSTLVRLTAALRARPFADGEVGAWTGAVRDSTPVHVDGTPAAVAAADETEHDGEGYQAVVARRRFESRAGFEVVTDQGPVLILPDEMLWASTARIVEAPRYGPMTEYTLIPVGGRALIWGRLATTSDDGWRLRAVHGQPPLVFAVPAGADPLRVARRSLVQHRAALAVIAACLLVNAALLLVA